MVLDNPKDFLSHITGDDAELVEHHLSKILASPHFKSAKQMQNFLQYIVRKTLAGNEKSLKQYTIAVEALGFPVDFDSDTNPVVRIKAGRVRERLAKYYEEEGENDALIISMPKGSYTPLFGKKPRVPNDDVISKLKDGHSLPPKLAVLCYSDETQNKESNRLLFQITDTMAKELSHFLFLRLVVSIPHADKRESQNASVDIKERYQADYMLNFYIHQLPKNHYKLLVRLVGVMDGVVLWSDSYELKDNELFEDQHGIIGNITAVVTDIQQGVLHHHWARKLLEDEESIAACYKVQTYYRYYNDDLSRAAFTKASDICQQQLEAHPNDIIALLVYADYCRRDYVYGYNVIESPLKMGKKVALRATHLQPSSHEAHYVLGQILFCLGEKQQSLTEFSLSRDIYQYDAVVEYGIGFHYCLMDHWKEGIEIIERVMSLSLTYPSWFNLTPFLNHYFNKDYDKALSYALKIDTPQTFHAPLSRCVSYSQLGETEKANTELLELLERYPDFMKKGQRLLERFLGSEELAAKLWEGVEKADLYGENG